MKKAFYALTLALAGIFATTPASATTADTLTLSAISSHSTTRICGSEIEYIVNAVYPIDGNKKLKESYLSWVDNQVARSISDTTVIKADRVNTLMSKLQLGFTEMSAKDIKAISSAAGGKKREAMQTANHVAEFRISKAYESGKHITIAFEGDLFMGGAHGVHYYQYATFVKKTGHLLTWNDILQKKQAKKFSQLTVEALRPYFGVQNWGQMKERLIVDGNVDQNNFPLPESAPAFLRDGLRVQYQHYEIAPYAMGAPSGLIPYSKALRCLNSTGKAFANQ